MCGTTNPDDALAAVQAGVDGLGLIFFAKSPRNVKADMARYIVRMLPPFINTVGVFVDRPIDEVVELVDFCHLTHVQLHGNEDQHYCRQLSERCNATLIKAFRVGSASVAADFTPYDDLVKGYLLDTYKKGVAGGTGEIFDWTIVDNLFLQRPVIMAGGLTPENVGEAIESSSPYAIDINSGVEKEPGIKDHDKLRALIEQVRLVDAAKT